MSSETDTSLSSVSSGHKKIRSSKKRKSKSEKKNKKRERKKRHELKKRTRHNYEVSNEISEVHSTNLTSCAESDMFGPALPLHLLQKQIPIKPAELSDKLKIIGPTLPSNLNTLTESTIATESEDQSDDIFGPTLATPDEMNPAQIELEQRALELKLVAIEGTSGANINQKEREEWMLELPEVGLKSGLAALANMKRTFHHGKERPDFSDRSSWTKTPNDGSETTQKPTNSKKAAENLKSDAQALYERQRDEEQARLVKKHKKKHKRDESLVEMHQKQRRKEQRKREKELTAAGLKAERRPFSRDVDLKPNKIDKHQTKQIVDKAKLFNTKFSSGQTKYL